MERHLGESAGGNGGVTGNLHEGDSPAKSKTNFHGVKKGVNSWDSSSPTAEGKRDPRNINNDWDSGSDCQVTMVEPFDNAKESDNWDSESEHLSNGLVAEVGEKVWKPYESHSDSLEFLADDLSDILQASEAEEFEREKKSKKKNTEKDQEDVLLVEDLEEFPANEDPWKIVESTLANDQGTNIRSKNDEGTPEDTTIWAIPKTERSYSAESTSKLISSSDRELQISIKKAKSSSDVGKGKSNRKPAKYLRSDCLGFLEAHRNKISLSEYEGPNLQRKLEINPKSPKEGISSCGSFDGTRVFFTEYECRPMTIDKQNLAKSVASSGSLCNREVLSSDSASVQTEDPPSGSEGMDGGEIGNSEGEANDELARAGPSAATTLDVISLPDMIGRNSIKERDKGTGQINTSREGKKEDEAPAAELTTRDNRMKESWFFLDETGQYQSVTLNEVSILLNGKSADAVLQERKEHFIVNPSAAESTGPRGSLSGMLTKESLQLLLRNEDTGGDKDGKKLIDLERKMENTLLYIQPSMNLKASIRFIPVDTEMIHLWRRTRDTGSVLSSEVDLHLFSSQDSVETTNPRHPNDHHLSSQRRVVKETSVAEQDEMALLVEDQDQSTDYSHLLIETRMMVDNLTHNFSALQSRLDGETSRSLVLQGEINKLRHLLKTMGGRTVDRSSREIINELPANPVNVESSPSVLIVKAPDKEDISESNTEEPSAEILAHTTFGKVVEVVPHAAIEEEMDDDCNGNGNITVNIYTVEETPQVCGFLRDQTTNTVVQSNLKVIEGKMHHLQQENEMIKKQNHELRRKLKEISQELEKYLSATSDSDICVDEPRELENLRDQVCNLKLELDSLKNSTRRQEEILVAESSLLREELAKTLFSLEEWCRAADGIFRAIQDAKSSMHETGISLDINLEQEDIQDPKSVSNAVNCYIRLTTQSLLKPKNENFLYKQTLGEESCKGISGETPGLEQEISGYSALMDEFRREQVFGDAENKVMEDYFAVILEKASLSEEVKILKTENELLCAKQLEHFERLKQTVIALEDKKNELKTLESSQKLSEEEKSKMAGVLKLYEEQNKNMKVENAIKDEQIQGLMIEMKKKDLEIIGCAERLKEAAVEVANFEKSCRFKDELINKLRVENGHHLAAHDVKDTQIKKLQEDIKNLQLEIRHEESELTTAKLLLNESQKEMSAYVTHLESVLNNTQDSLEKTKQKLRESNQTICRIRSENDVFDKQHQCDLRLYNRTKDELESCREQLLNLDQILREAEKERENLKRNAELLIESEKKKSEALDLLGKEYKKMVDANTGLRETVETLTKDNDESLKEHKDLINKYAMMSGEVRKLQEKYRNVKLECNERTDLIRYLEMMLKENLVEYNGRIACLEQNISRMIDKIMACKNCMKEKRNGVEAEVRELRHQLGVIHQERRQLEEVVDNYYCLMKRLKDEIHERELQVNDLHVRLELEQQKRTADFITEEGCLPCRAFLGEYKKGSDRKEVAKLESQIVKAEYDLSECRKELQKRQVMYDTDKKKLELTIADLRLEINKYQLRLEVMMRNLSGSNRQSNGCNIEKSQNSGDDNVQSLRKELEEKVKKNEELNEIVNKYKVELKLKDSDLANSKKKNICLEEELRSLKEVLSIQTKVDGTKRHERDEMAEKLLQSIKLLMDEKAARQASELLAMEKETNLKKQLNEIKNEMDLKVKECEALSSELQEEKSKVNKLENSLRKSDLSEAGVFKISNSRNKASKDLKSENCDDQQCQNSTPKNYLPKSSETRRLESCLKELKEVRGINLQLRKMEGQCQAKIVSQEEELRDARLLIKELQGDVQAERKSKRILKDMILMTQKEIEKCILAKELILTVAQRISRHLNLSDTSPRKLLSAFRLSDYQHSKNAQLTQE